MADLDLVMVMTLLWESFLCKHSDPNESGREEMSLVEESQVRSLKAFNIWSNLRSQFVLLNHKLGQTSKQPYTAV